ncbi:MAG: hypothetical protein KDC54_12070 [Lewinella sp.]|nr:hypothetical protein [Lewinella sp.]
MAAKSGYSEWQLWRIRDALSAYKAYEKAEDQRECGWPDIHQAILEQTGFHIGKSLKVGAEALRKFVEGVPDETKIGGRHWRDPDWASHAVDFLTHPDIDYLSTVELEEEDADGRFALYLSRFVWEPAKLAQLNADMPVGRYSARDMNKIEYVVRELYLQPFSQEKVFKATLIETYYPEEAIRELHGWTGLERREKRKAYLVTPGWGVLAPDNKLSIWLKDEDSGYQQLSSVTGLWDSDVNFFSKVLMLSESDAPFSPLSRISPRSYEIKDKYLKLLETRLISDFVLVSEDVPVSRQEEAHG